MRVAPEGLRDDLFELGFYLVDGLARSEAGAIADPEYVRVDRERFLAERCVEDDVCSLAADTRKRLQLIAGPRNLAPIVVDQCLA